VPYGAVNQAIRNQVAITLVFSPSSALSAHCRTPSRVLWREPNNPTSPETRLTAGTARSRLA
jgi:hypothetical protein